MLDPEIEEMIEQMVSLDLPSDEDYYNKLVESISDKNVMKATIEMEIAHKEDRWDEDRHGEFTYKDKLDHFVSRMEATPR